MKDSVKHPGKPDTTDHEDAQANSKIQRAIAEYSEGVAKMSAVHPAVSIFGSARTPRDHPHYQLAQRTAQLLSESGFSIISGGGPGVMEAANRGATKGKGTSVGLNISLSGRETQPNGYQDIAVNFNNFFTRKLFFMEYACAFVVMPGGFGTLDEVMECLTLIQTNKTPRIPVILADQDFWNGLLAWFQDTLLLHGAITESDLNLFQVMDQPEDIRDAILSFYETNDEN